MTWEVNTIAIMSNVLYGSKDLCNSILFLPIQNLRIPNLAIVKYVLLF